MRDMALVEIVRNIANERVDIMGNIFKYGKCGESKIIAYKRFA